MWQQPPELVTALGWRDLLARRASAGDAWPLGCPLCGECFDHDDCDGQLRWLADYGRLVLLPDGCAAHRYCAIENPHRDHDLIVRHEHQFQTPQSRHPHASPLRRVD